MEICVILGREKPAGATFAVSGCSSILDFLSSPLLLNAAVRQVNLVDELDPSRTGDKGCLYISAKGVRDREEVMEAGSFARFLHALPTSLPPSCTDLHIVGVELISEEELCALCGAIGNPLCKLSQLRIEGLTIRNTDAAKAVFEEAFYNNTSLSSLTLYVSEVCSADCLIPALTRKPCSIKELMLCFKSPYHTLEDVSGIFTGLAHNAIALTKLTVYNLFFGRSGGTVSEETSELIGTVLRTNTSLEFLGLFNYAHLPGRILQMMFTSLGKNTHLTHLSLAGCGGYDWPTATFLLDALRVNGYLSHLDLESTPLEGKDEAAINAQLARNRQKAEQMKSLRIEGIALVRPTTVRLFLCGLPFSGKTTLSRSLVRWNTSNSCLTNFLPWAQTNMPERTRGIEVSTVENDGVKVSLWDMAGQAEYYAFHDQMFPDLSNDATPSLFLFVWSPIQLDKSTGKEIRDQHRKHSFKTLNMFEDEFRYWLRFITSKTLKSLRFRPKLLVAITRADLLPSSIKTWISNTFIKCQNDFQDHVEFDLEGVFEMNARNPSQVKDLAHHVFDCATSILNSKPHVYEACNQARRELTTSVRLKKLAPLITKGDFFSVCRKDLGLDSKEMQEAVALSLNESGDLIYFKALDLVVIDTQWFCYHFMGDLLYFSNTTTYQHEGFFSPKFLQDLLESKVCSTRVRGNRRTVYRTLFAKSTRVPTIKGEALVKLLIGLQLACLKDDGQANSDIFIPASLCSVPRRQVDPHQYLSGDKNIRTFVGRRLKCLDSICTFFTPGIFSLLQVAFKCIFQEVVVTLHEDVIAFFRDGVKVLIEFCKHEGRDHFIDVLLHSRLDLDNTIEWAYEAILHRMEEICAEPKGIQGVQLVYEVIRPCSVQEYDCMEKRLGAAVSGEELRASLSRSLEKKGFQPDCIESVFHAWQTTNDFDRVIDLLGNAETLKIIKEYRQKFIVDVECTLGVNAEEKNCVASEPVERVFSSSTSGTEREWIYNEVRSARKDIQEVHKQIQKLGEDVQNISQSILPQVVQRIEELLTFAKDGEVTKLPRLFVVTRNDKGLARKVVGAMVPGLRNVRLELLCEHRNRPHLVAEQQGIVFATLEDGLLKQGLPYFNMFLQLASLAVKVGAHVTAGCGDAIPDFRQVLALVVDTVEFPKLPTIASFQDPYAPGTSRVNLQEGQQWLFHVLAKHDCCSSARIHEVFRLTRVQYHDPAGFGWLCDKHRSVGDLCYI